jgi:hypothetical protein
MHRSLENVRKYKRPSEQMLREISSALESNEPAGKTAKLEIAWIRMNQRSKIEDCVEPNEPAGKVAKIGDCECKNTFSNCKVYFSF